MTSFTVNIIISRKLFKNFQVAYMNRFRPLYRTTGFWAGVVMLAMAIISPIVTRLSGNQDGEDRFILVFLFFPLFMILVRYLVYYKAGKTYDSNAKLQRPIQYTFDEQQVKLKGENFETIYPWSEAKKLKKTKDFIALFVTNTAAVIIPCDQVSDDEILFIEQQFAKRKA